jgi:hypothetical protein
LVSVSAPKPATTPTMSASTINSTRSPWKNGLFKTEGVTGLAALVPGDNADQLPRATVISSDRSAASGTFSGVDRPRHRDHAVHGCDRERHLRRIGHGKDSTPVNRSTTSRLIAAAAVCIIVVLGQSTPAEAAQISAGRQDAGADLLTSAATAVDAVVSTSPDSYAGVWIDRHGGQVVIPAAAHLDDAALQIVEKRFPTVTFTEQSVAYSWRHLQDVTNAVTAKQKGLLESGVDLESWGPDTETNSVVVALLNARAVDVEKVAGIDPSIRITTVAAPLDGVPFSGSRRSVPMLGGGRDFAAAILAMVLQATSSVHRALIAVTPR